MLVHLTIELSLKNLLAWNRCAFSTDRLQSRFVFWRHFDTLCQVAAYFVSQKKKLIELYNHDC